ncbi:TPA: cysteine peptidase family C39 domain-containing protein, partial [Escherichia coli]
MMSKCSSHNSLYALILLAQYHNITVNAETIRHQYNTHTQDFGVTEWLLAAKSIGLKAKYVEKHFSRLSIISLPALIWRDDGKHYILSRVTKDSSRYLVYDPEQ